jgi:hypothetical protein
MVYQKVLIPVVNDDDANSTKLKIGTRLLIKRDKILIVWCEPYREHRTADEKTAVDELVESERLAEGSRTAATDETRFVSSLPLNQTTGGLCREFVVRERLQVPHRSTVFYRWANSLRIS